MITPPNETPVDGAKCELFEETGYIPALIVPFGLPDDFFVEDESEGEISPPALQQFLKEMTIYIFLARVDQEQDPVLNPAEHTA
ncbi:MAG: NUDIX domain-containing protein [Promethearchaeota archaeon]